MLIISLETILYPICLLLAICYPLPWLMHLCAMANAATKRDINSKKNHPLSSHDTLNLNASMHNCLTNFHESLLDYSEPELIVADQKDIARRYKNNLIENNISNDPQRHQENHSANQIPHPHRKNSIISKQIDITENISSNHNQTIHQNYCTYDIYKYSEGLLKFPGVSILKPLVGVDKNLEENLETFFQMSYPTHELLFCIQDLNDEAMPLVRKLIAKYPNIDAKLFVGGARVGVNPKINNMQPAYDAARYELILISDSGISMKHDTLRDMVLDMTDNVALVHQMPFVKTGRLGFYSILETVYFGTAHARAYLTADLLGINCPTGMSALMRKHLLDEVGGIKSFGQYLAEDFFFAKSFTDRGWEITISRQPAWQNSSSNGTVWTLYGRIERWIKLRFAMVPHWTILEPFSECMLLGVVESSVHCHLWAFNPYIFFLVHVLVWLTFDYRLLCTIQNGLNMKLYQFLLAWLIRELSAIFIFIKALCNPSVKWRSRVFKLKWGGLAEEVTPFWKQQTQLP